MDKESNVNSISTTELLIIIGGGLLWMNWFVGLAFIVGPIAMLEWKERSKNNNATSQSCDQGFITSAEMIAAT